MSRTVLVLDDDDDLRTTLSDVLRLTCDMQTLDLPDVASMIAASDRVLACDLALIDVNLGAGQPSGLDAYRWLVSQGFKGRIVFLTGHARAHAMVQETVDSGAAVVIQKPASVSTLRRVCGGTAA